MLKPSDFTEFLMNNFVQKQEAEQVAKNIMVILERTGNELRQLTWNEYVTERMKDGNFSRVEKKYFDQVIKYFKNSDTVQLFSPNWEKE